jgi:hypothetical protein
MAYWISKLREGWLFKASSMWSLNIACVLPQLLLRNILNSLIFWLSDDDDDDDEDEIEAADEDEEPLRK